LTKKNIIFFINLTREPTRLTYQLIVDWIGFKFF